MQAPFEGHDTLRSPNRNLDLLESPSSLTAIYKSAYSRVGE